MRWRWDVDDEAQTAAFEIMTTKAEEEIGQETAHEFARALDAAGIQTVTVMLRTRNQPGLVTILWTGEVSDPRRTRRVFGAYERALASHEPTALG